MSRADLDVRATILRDQGVPFVRARVVMAHRPTSAKAGDEAIIHADGSIEGFVGGTCAETTVRAQSLMLLDSKQPLLLRITPTEEPGVAEQNGTLTVHNPCLSGGTLEIFLDPVVPPPLVQVLGDGPIAAALTRLAGELEYRITAVDRQVIGTALAVVVASHGRDEVEVLAAALDAGGALHRPGRQSHAGGRRPRRTRRDAAGPGADRSGQGAHSRRAGHRRPDRGGDRSVDSRAGGRDPAAFGGTGGRRSPRRPTSARSRIGRGRRVDRDRPGLRDDRCRGGDQPAP